MQFEQGRPIYPMYAYDIEEADAPPDREPYEPPSSRVAQIDASVEEAESNLATLDAEYQRVMSDMEAATTENERVTLARQQSTASRRRREIERKLTTLRFQRIEALAEVIDTTQQADTMNDAVLETLEMYD